MAEDLVFLSPNTLTPTETCRETGRRQRQKDGHKHTCAYTVGGVFCSLRAFYVDLQKPGVWVSRCTAVQVQAADFVSDPAEMFLASGCPHFYSLIVMTSLPHTS